MRFVFVIMDLCLLLTLIGCSVTGSATPGGVNDGGDGGISAEDADLSDYIVGVWDSHVSSMTFNADGTGIEYGDDDGPGAQFTYSVDGDKLTIGENVYTVVTGTGRELNAGENFGVGGVEDDEMMIFYADGECCGVYWRP